MIQIDPISEATTLDLLESVLSDNDLLCFAHWGTLEEDLRERYGE